MPGKLRTEYLLTAGSNFPDPTPEWTQESGLEQYRAIAPGTHGGPAASIEDDTGVYVGSAGTENIENYLIKLSPDGSKRLWWKGVRVAWCGAAAMARSGDRLLVLSTNKGEIWPYLAADGQDLPTINTALPAAPNEPADKPDPARIASDLAANDREAVICFPAHGLVRWIDPKTGATIAEVTGLTSPIAVAIKPDGTTFALCGDKLIRLDRAGKNHTELAAGLIEPTRLGVLANGDLLVFQGGKNMQLVRFSADGHRLAAYGRASGRLDGRYDLASQESFLTVTSIHGTPDGGFIINEPWTGPRRTARFDASGHFINEWYGGNVWGPWIAVDPADPRTIFMPTTWGWVMRLEVDYTHKTWRVRSVHHTEGMADGIFPGHTNADIYTAIRHDGNLYLAHNTWPWVVMRVDDASDQLVPVMAANPQMRNYLQYQAPVIREWAAADDQNYVWTDTNGDGRPQRDEVHFYKKVGLWVAMPEVDAGGITAVTSGAWTRWTLTGWNSVGAPTLGDFPTGTLLTKVPVRAGGIEPRWASYIARDAATGGYFAAYNANMPDWGTSKDSFVCSYDAQGKQRWTAGGRTIGTEQAFIGPNDIGCFRAIAGVTHGCVVANDFLEGPYPLVSYVWDNDGLWVGGVMDEIDRDAAPTWRYGAGAEAFGTVMHTDPKTGEVLLFWHGMNDVRIGRVTGWDGWERKNGTIDLATAAAPFAPSVTEVRYGTGTGLWLEGWRQGITTPVVERLTNAAESWGLSKGPDGLMIFAGLLARVTGEIQPLHTGWHTFQLPGMPRLVLRIGDHYIFNHGRVASDDVYLEAGKLYPILIEYDPWFTHPSTIHGIQLRWATPRGTSPGVLEPIPVSQIYPSSPAAKTN